LTRHLRRRAQASRSFKPAGEHHDDKASAEGGADGDLDADDRENWLSLAAIEAELKPKVIETFDTVACGPDEVLVSALCKDGGGQPVLENGRVSCSGTSGIVGLCMRR
jgi:hypothetical protein